ncbi:hypothetical protein P7C73_g1950, partial [Tremellales sp. Uapishka_1]
MEYISWQEVEKLRSLLVLADKYDCPLALQMLKGLVISYVRPDTEYDESMDLFRLTTEYHLNDTVVRILKLGVEWESPAYMLGKEDGEGWSFHPSAMERDFFESIPSPYAWCLVRACLDVPHRCDVDGKYEAVDRFEKLLNTIAANENDARIQKRKREADESAKAKKKKVDEEKQEQVAWYADTYEKAVGDIILISADKKAFRVASDELKLWSGVFRDMLSTADSTSPSEIELPEHSKSIAIFVSAVKEEPRKSFPWNDAEKGLQFCRKYDAPHLGRRVLTALPLDDTGPKDLIDVFSWACIFDDPGCGGRVLAEGYRAEGYFKNYVVVPLRPLRWTQTTARGFTCRWVLALTQALEDSKAIGDEKLPGFWLHTAGSFLKRVSSRVGLIDQCNHSTDQA